ncbi:MAG: Unknown protein [uncultured Sulfurovum sp.]|uniref:Nitric oxide-responding transcriptional regulator Dnr (Crp/Fnr family) n=1 Tax=uncultured Sulfurovum sp. TaxID=269237 RepID=A0A6S6T788_9BACT|nr:MAG: Unknown protein [uncultured Sulfurovum sp.]
MKLVKTFLIFGLLLSTTLTAKANDYALLDTYPLLNDMKILKKEQGLLNSMRSSISDRKNNNKAKLAKEKEVFTKIIRGLSKGDSSLGLQGTELVSLKNKINTIQLIWSQEKSILDSALNHKMYKNDAYATIKKLSTQLTALNKLYQNSYTRYKKNSVMKSLVSSYMKRNDRLRTKPMYAMNTVK